MDLRHLLEQAQNLDRAFKELDERLKSHRAVGRSADGRVEVHVDGRGDVLGLRIDDELVASGDAGQVATAVLAALREATAASRSYREEQRARITGGLRIPEF